MKENHTKGCGQRKGHCFGNKFQKKGSGGCQEGTRQQGKCLNSAKLSSENEAQDES